MSKPTKIGEALDLLFLRRSLAESEQECQKLSKQLKGALKELKVTKLALSASDIRVKKLEKNLVKLVDDFLDKNTASSNPNDDAPVRRKTKTKTRSSSKTLLVYFVFCEPASAVKIGYTTNIKNRLSNLQTGNAFKLSLLGIVYVPDKSWEKKIHHALRAIHLTGEWFSINKFVIDAFNEFILAARSGGKNQSEALNIPICELEDRIQRIFEGSELQNFISRRDKTREEAIALVEQADLAVLLPLLSEGLPRSACLPSSK